MVKRAFIAIVIVLFGLTSALGVLAVQMEVAPETPVGGDNWPAGVADWVNGRPRVYAHTGTFAEHLYYSGDTAALNKFLEPCAKITGVPVTLVLHCGRGWTSGLTGGRSVFFDWSVTCMNLDVRLEGEPPEKPGKLAKIRIDLWLGGDVELSKLVVPSNAEVKSAGEIEKFVADHDAKRKAAAQPHTDRGEHAQ